jgi:hypothetical protein
VGGRAGRATSGPYHHGSLLQLRQLSDAVPAEFDTVTPTSDDWLQLLAACVRLSRRAAGSGSPST